jgi:ferritin-like protein
MRKPDVNRQVWFSHIKFVTMCAPKFNELQAKPIIDHILNVKELKNTSGCDSTQIPRNRLDPATVIPAKAGIQTDFLYP